MAVQKQSTQILAVDPQFVHQVQKPMHRSGGFDNSGFEFSAGTSHQELKEYLESRRGTAVAVGEYPPWLEESSDVISAYVPTQDGKVKRGIY